MTKPEFKKILDEYLIEGDEDYISLLDVITDVGGVLKLNKLKLTPSEGNELWIGIQEFIVLMLENGFEAIDLEREGKCSAWPDQGPEAVIAEIKKRWAESPEIGQIGTSVWFNKIAKNPVHY